MVGTVVSRSTNIWCVLFHMGKRVMLKHEWHRVTDAFSSPTVLKARLLDDFKDILESLILDTLPKREMLSSGYVKLLI